MERKKQTAKAYFTQLKIIHFALLAGQLFLLVIFSFLNDEGQVIFKFDLANVHTLLVPFVLTAGIVVGYVLGQQKDKMSRTKSDLQEKFSSYRTTSMLKWATVEGPNLFSLVAYLLSGNVLFVIYFGVGVFYFLSLRPTPKKAIKELQLNKEEQAQVNDPNTIIASI